MVRVIMPPYCSSCCEPLITGYWVTFEVGNKVWLKSKLNEKKKQQLPYVGVGWEVGGRVEQITMVRMMVRMMLRMLVMMVIIR